MSTPERYEPDHSWLGFFKGVAVMVAIFFTAYVFLRGIGAMFGLDW